jgi:hypothetical protein
MDVFTHHYELHYQKKKVHLVGPTLLSLRNLVAYLFIHPVLEIG